VTTPRPITTSVRGRTEIDTFDIFDIIDE